MRPSAASRSVPAVSAAWLILAACLAGAGGCASRGTPWTIKCLQLSGPQGREHIRQVGETLKRTPGIRSDEVFIIDQEDGSSALYYGKYYRKTDPETGRRTIPRRLAKDLEYIKQLGDAPGKYFFLQATKVRMPTPDVGNPSWSLTNAEGSYTLQVAAFEPTEDFTEYKQAAADYCRMLRDAGFEAYYHHTDAVSVVSVGLFGPQAVRTAPDGRRYYSEEVIRLQESNDLLKYNRVNGAIMRVRSDDGAMIPVPSRLVEIPSNSEALQAWARE